MAPDVFISYCSQDKTIAEAVCAGLEAEKVTCWIAPRDVPPGANYGAAINDAIAEARLMVAIFSSHANQSPRVSHEIERAVQSGHVVIPFKRKGANGAKILDTTNEIFRAPRPHGQVFAVPRKRR